MNQRCEYLKGAIYNLEELNELNWTTSKATCTWVCVDYRFL